MSYHAVSGLYEMEEPYSYSGLWQFRSWDEPDASFLLLSSQDLRWRGHPSATPTRTPVRRENAGSPGAEHAYAEPPGGAAA